MNELAIFQSFGKGTQTRAAVGSHAVIYTRVSTKDQTENLSLETQRKACIECARKSNLTIVEQFGGTHESATSDTERKEFTRMIEYVKKSRHRISNIIVYSLDRFSRNENAIWLSAKLRELHIEVLSATQPMDMSNSAGQMHQRLVMVFNQFENDLRREKCTAGMKEMLLRGDWPTKPALGYDIERKNSRRTIVVNERGKILRLAFAWKLEGLTHDAIRARLATHGIVLCRQRITAVLRNPFYCGVLAHNMLGGQIVQGNHEPLITRELFLRVNGLMDGTTHGYNIQEENEHIPLKRFLLCDKCNAPLRGYIVKKKNIYYYKCCTIGCNTNKNAETLHERFADVLQMFTVDYDSNVVRLFKTQAIATFNQFTKGFQDTTAVLQQRQQELQKKVARLEERFIEEELTAELYNKYTEKYQEELSAIDTELAKASHKVSNLSEYIDKVVDFAANMPKKWVLADYTTKQRMQKMLFPLGIFYNKETDKCRTERVNLLFLYLAHFKQVILKQNRDIADFAMPLFDLSRSVAEAELEPTISWL